MDYDKESIIRVIQLRESLKDVLSELRGKGLKLGLF